MGLQLTLYAEVDILKPLARRSWILVEDHGIFTLDNRMFLADSWSLMPLSGCRSLNFQGIKSITARPEATNDHRRNMVRGAIHWCCCADAIMQPLLGHNVEPQTCRHGRELSRKLPTDLITSLASLSVLLDARAVPLIGSGSDHVKTRMQRSVVRSGVIMFVRGL